MNQPQKEGSPAISRTWANPESIMLSEISQKENDKYCMTSFRCGILKKKKADFTETDNRMVVLRGKWVDGRSKGTSFQLLEK